MITFNVTGMTCGGCARAVTNAVHQVDPAATVEIDLAAKTVRVTSAASADRLQSAIEEAGYQVSR
jgi:copper chaperone